MGGAETKGQERSLEMSDEVGVWRHDERQDQK